MDVSGESNFTVLECSGIALSVPGIGVGSGVSRGALQRVQKNAFGLMPQGSYLVDPASSHMLVSKIKPCMSKYKLLIL